MRQAATIGIAVLLGAGTLAAIRYARAPVVLAAGRFHAVAHKGSGFGVLYRARSGKPVVKIVCLRTGLRPDLAVYLIGARDAFDNDTVKNSPAVLLGMLKGTAAEQEFEVPAGVDVSRYHAVTIWSEKYQVNFTTAPLR